MIYAPTLVNVCRYSVMTCLWVWCVSFLVAADSSSIDQTRVSYRADDQNAAIMLPALSTLAGERYEPEIDLLLDGVTATQATFALHNASRSSCRQALAFALGCWWTSATDDLDQKIILTNKESMPRGDLSARTTGSTLLRQPSAQFIAESMLKPWLGGQAAISLLPVEGIWSATLDEAGHRRLIEVISLLERPQATASSWIPDPDIIDVRRMTSMAINVSSWSTLVTGLSQTGSLSVSLSPRLRLRVFPNKNLLIERMSLSDVAVVLHSYGMRVFWHHGVMCLGEANYDAEDADREHPAQRRRLALVSIEHLIKDPLDGELIVASLQNKIAPRWWSHSCAAMRYLPATQSLLIAADIPTQHALFQALGTLDRLGLELGLSTLGLGSQP